MIYFVKRQPFAIETDYYSYVNICYPKKSECERKKREE